MKKIKEMFSKSVTLKNDAIIGDYTIWIIGLVIINLSYVTYLPIALPFCFIKGMLVAFGSYSLVNNYKTNN